MAFAGDTEASSSSRPNYHNQVFLSFRGRDTRLNFISHLYAALVNEGINTFKDDESINRGETIISELKRGIHESSVSLIVFSKDYASSRWCLNELVMILEHSKASEHVVIPLFYDVEPTNVRYQTGSIGESFAKHEEKVQREPNAEIRNKLREDITRWREALAEAAGSSGIELIKVANGDEAKFVQEVVGEVESRLKPRSLNVDPDKLVGLSRCRLEDIDVWIKDAYAPTVMLICGIGGIGKTTIAKKIYNDNYRDFDASSFLEGISERLKHYDDVVKLQKQLLSDICRKRTEDNNILSTEHGFSKIRKVLGRKKVLLVLDDIDNVEKLEAIFEMPRPGSKIIVTARNKHNYITERCMVHEVATLGYYESVHLFSLHAFRRNHPIESYKEHVDKIVSHCDGLPLALKLLGAALYGEEIDIWKSQIESLNANPNRDIIKTLKISFDCLKHEYDKNVFLDIACFFVGEERNYTIKILDACRMSAAHAIANLVRACLLKIQNDKLIMHQLVKDMGRDIVHNESRDYPGECSRLWRSEDCFNVLREKTGTTRVQALAFDMQTYRELNHAEPIICRANSENCEFEEKCTCINPVKQIVSDFFSWSWNLILGNNVRNSNEMGIDTDAFLGMQSLMILKLSNVELSGSYAGFPKGLRWLSWHRCHLKCMPSDLSLTKLVCLEMQYSSLEQLWKAQKDLPALKFLDLSHSLSLATSPEFSKMPKLERLILKGCTKLSAVCESISSAKGLVLINLKDCVSLRKLPKNISLLHSLEKLDISGCSSLSEIPRGMSNIESLKWFNANRIDMSALVSPAKGISCWASFPRFMEKLSLENCNLTNDCFPKDFSNLSSLKRLNLSGNLITSLPDCCGSLSNLVFLNVGGCSVLESVVSLPIIIKRGLSEGLPNIGDIEADKEFLGLVSSQDYIYWEDCPRLAEIEGCYKRVSIRDSDRGIISKLGLMDLDPSLFESYLFNNVEVEERCGTWGTFLPLDNLPERFNSISFQKYNYNWTARLELCVAHKGKRIQGLTLAFLYHERPAQFGSTLRVINGRKQLDYRSYENSGASSKDGGVVRLWHIHLWKPFLQPGDLIQFTITIIDTGHSYPCPEASGIMFVEEEEDRATGFDLSSPFPFTHLLFYSSATTLAGGWANECPKCGGDQIPEGKTVGANTLIWRVCRCHRDSVNKK